MPIIDLCTVGCEKMPDAVSSWMARYTITIGTMDKRPYEIDIDDPTEEKIVNSPFYKGDKENTRRYLVRREADVRISRFCDHLSVETNSPTRYELNSLDFMENGIKKFSQREISFGVSAYIGSPISQEEFLVLEKEISSQTKENELLDRYAMIYNKHLKSNDAFEKFKLLYIIASKDANNDLELRTIRNMLHHEKLDESRKDKCKKADELFGNGVRSIDLSNSDHQKIVSKHLIRLKEIAKATIDRLK
jgi:hypothetical protein